MKDTSEAQEPCFQSKKRLEGPATSLSASDFANFNNIEQDYILLGKNDKFHHNIQYKCRPIKTVSTAEMNENENAKTESNLPGNLQGSANDYILLGNNTKFKKNIIYKPKPCPEVMAVNGKGKENSRVQEESRSMLSNLGDEYMLLGNNAKFSDNIVYKPKRWHEYISSHVDGKENEPAGDTEVQDEKLEPAPIVDTSKFREGPKKSKKPVGKTDDSELKIKKKKKSANQEGDKEDLHLSLENLHSGREAIDGKFNAKVLKGGSTKSKDVSGAKEVTFQSPPAAPRSAKSSNVQKDGDQKLLALLHKAGIRLPACSIAEQSEYQKNFTWKNPVPDSTAVENKKNFMSSNVLITPASHQNSIPKTTEYQKNFQAWLPLPTKPESPSAKIVEKAIVPSSLKVQKEPKHRTSKHSSIEKTSKTNLSPSTQKADQLDNTNQGQESDDDELNVGFRESGIGFDEDADNNEEENNMKITESHESHRESQCYNSEYRACFKAPSKFDYLKNAWDSTSSSQEDILQKDDSGKDDWYAEVCDLRRKAAEYRRRANNTHFCSNHVGQLLASETQLWEHHRCDKPSTPEIDVRSMRPAGITYNKHYQQKPLVSQKEQSPNNPAEPLMTMEDVSDDDDEDVASVHSEPKVVANCIPASSEPNVVPASTLEKISGGAYEDPEVLLDTSTGRIPSPELPQQNIKRHHLDRTTPTKGGFLLISPMRNKKGIDSEQANTPNTPEPVDSIFSSPYHSASDAEGKPKHCVKTCPPPSKTNCQTTYGVPSKDTHVLRAQENLSSSTRSLPKSPLVEPTQLRNDVSPNVTLRSGGNKRPKKSQTKQHPAGLKSSHPRSESKISTYTVPQHITNDILNQSLESNSSLASEILERTRKRLDFW